jgi:energy-coupling factor transporter transmembrane protein EcfT
MPMPVTIPISVVFALIILVFVLAVVVPLIVPALFVLFVTSKVLFPSDVPSPIGPFTAVWAITPVPVPRIEVAIHIPMKTYGAMEPGTSADEDSPDEPLRSVIAERCAAIGLVVEVSVWTNRSDCYRGHGNWSANSNVDTDLRLCLLGYPRHAHSYKSHGDTQF